MSVPLAATESDDIVGSSVRRPSSQKSQKISELDNGCSSKSDSQKDSPEALEGACLQDQNGCNQSDENANDVSNQIDSGHIMHPKTHDKVTKLPPISTFEQRISYISILGKQSLRSYQKRQQKE